MLKELFKNVPKEHFTLSMKGYRSTGSYYTNEGYFETFVHEDNKRIQVTVNVETLEIVNIDFGRFRI